MIDSAHIGTLSTSAIKTTSPLAAKNFKRIEVILQNLDATVVYVRRGASASATNFDFTLIEGEKVVMDNWLGEITCFPTTGVSVNVTTLQ